MKLRDTLAERMGKVIPSTGPVPADLMIVGEAPGAEEAREGRPFVGTSGKLLRKTLSTLGIDPASVYITNVCWFRPKGNRTPTPSEIEESLPRLYQEIKIVKPKKILALGSTSMTALGLDVLGTISKSRGLFQKAVLPDGSEVPAIVSYHPAYILRNPSSFRDFLFDLQKLVSQEGPRENYYEYTVAKTVEEARAFLMGLLSASQLALDIETTGFDPFRDEVLLWGFAGIRSDGIITVLEIPNNLVTPQDLLWFFDEYRRRGGTLFIHNASFDLKWVYLLSGFERTVSGIRVAPRKFPRILDTLHMHSLLDERPGARGGSHDLKTLSKLWYDLPYDKIKFDDFVQAYREGSLSDRDWEEMFGYLAKDCYATLKLGIDLGEELRRESPKFFPLLEEHIMPAVLEFSRVELEGVPLSREYLKEFRSTAQKTKNDLLSKLQAVAERVGLHRPRIEFDLSDEATLEALKAAVSAEEWSKAQQKIQELRCLFDELQVADGEARTSLQRRIKLRENWVKRLAGAYGLYSDASAEFNPGSPVQVKELLSRVVGSPVTSTDKESLLLLQLNGTEEVQEIVRTLIDYRLADRILSTYIDGLLELSREDGFIHPKFRLNGASSGRISCTNPNLQNIPTLLGPDIRRAFVAPPGWVWAAIDYSQLELRVAAFYSRDPVMIEAYRSGRDIHTEVASAAYGVPPEEVTYSQRYAAKYIDFGVIYGRSAKSLIEGWELIEHWKKTNERPWTVEEAQSFIDRFLDQFKGLRRWIERQHAFVDRYQFVESLNGRRRRFPLIPTRSMLNSTYRKAVNTPIQGFASDICLKAFTLVSQRLDREIARPLITVHDEIDFIIRADKVTEVVEIVRDVMETQAPPREMSELFPIRVDVELGLNWGDITEEWRVSNGRLELRVDDSWVDYLDLQQSKEVA